METIAIIPQSTRIPVEALLRHQPAPVSGFARVATKCSNCSLGQLCLSNSLQGKDMDQLDTLVHTRRRIKRGETLYRAGDPFQSLYAVRSGFFKTYVITEDGREQVTGFQMAAEIVGMDGMGNDFHNLYAVALEDSEVCVIPYTHLEELAGQVRGLQRQFHRIMSREITHDQGVMMMLGSMRAEERLAAFLINLSHRFVARGYASSEFNLRMKREEIGSYLGLTFETVSRIFSKFQNDDLIRVHQKHIEILDIVGLQKMTIRAPEAAGKKKCA